MDLVKSDNYCPFDVDNEMNDDSVCWQWQTNDPILERWITIISPGISLTTQTWLICLLFCRLILPIQNDE